MIVLVIMIGVAKFMFSLYEFWELFWVLEFILPVVIMSGWYSSIPVRNWRTKTKTAFLLSLMTTYSGYNILLNLSIIPESISSWIVIWAWSFSVLIIFILTVVRWDGLESEVIQPGRIYECIDTPKGNWAVVKYILTMGAGGSSFIYCDGYIWEYKKSSGKLEQRVSQIEDFRGIKVLTLCEKTNAKIEYLQQKVGESWNPIYNNCMVLPTMVKKVSGECQRQVVKQ